FSQAHRSVRPGNHSHRSRPRRLAPGVGPVNPSEGVIVMRPVLFLAPAIALVLSAQAAHGQVATDVGLPKACTLAQQLVPGGYLIRARVEFIGAAKRYGFYFWYNFAIYEIEIKANGKVAKDEKVDNIPGGGTVGEPGNTDTDDESVDPKVIEAI